ncbi:AHH domain-containing protein [Bacillus sp. DX4.1]|uniref:AHH domain-containing protein n=1 Tax=Bacillus sp. DX4.1 TaxID=3055867 RepID=UPI0025A0EA86|nr:AHH domain-containing protein [Bacillus sp. DX4.1]MDM5186258.1 AHH domain-containing protein [Bacillus sp. DX4.1]
MREQASHLADDYATKIRSDETWTQLTKEHGAKKQPSKILGEELENAGIPRPTTAKHQAHHIVPDKQGHLRKYLEKYGIEGNSAANGVFLPEGYHLNWPGQVTHSPWSNLNEKGAQMYKHGNEYIRFLKRNLNEIDMLSVSNKIKRQKILDFLEETRRDLLTGKIEFLYKD